MKYNSEIKAIKDDLIFDEWVVEGVRSRVGRRKRVKNLKRSQASKRAWKLNGRNMKTSIGRFHKSPAGKRLHKNLGRFNKQQRGRNALNNEYELLTPFITMSIAEHLSWLVSQSDYDLYEDVYIMQDLLSLILDCPDIVEDVLAMDYEGGRNAENE